MSPAALLATLSASGITNPVALTVDGRIVLAGEADTVVAALRGMGDPGMADRVSRWLQDARGIVIAIEGGQVEVAGLPRDVQLTSTGGAS